MYFRSGILLLTVKRSWCVCVERPAAAAHQKWRIYIVKFELMKIIVCAKEAIDMEECVYTTEETSFSLLRLFLLRQKKNEKSSNKFNKD